MLFPGQHSKFKKRSTEILHRDRLTIFSIIIVIRTPTCEQLKTVMGGRYAVEKTRRENTPWSIGTDC